MLFNSIGFAVFLTVVFFLYWFVAKNNLRKQNSLLLLASYFFYGCWDWRFLLLLVFSTYLDYFTGLKIAGSKAENRKRHWFLLSVLVNLGFLAVFKYFDFFSTSFTALLSGFGLQASPLMLNVVLPVGISFYTFHGLSYVIDIYKARINPESNFVNYSVFVCFFPLLVAGPIERATHLLPQIQRERSFSYAQAVDGLKQILWGLFKKIVIADQCASFANQVFDHSANYSGSTLLVGAIFFAFQIYGDFSGYSDISIGTAKLFGIKLIRNFNFPYFSRNIAEFWRRWHISLSTWFRDYLYIPLGGSRGTLCNKLRNTFIVFLVSGFWHGANWTFLVWGFLHACYMVPSLLGKHKSTRVALAEEDRDIPAFKELGQMLGTFFLVVIAWVFFRAATVHDGFSIVSKIFSSSLFHALEISPRKILAVIFLFLVLEWFGRREEYAIQQLRLPKLPIIRWGFYLALCFAIVFFQGKQQTFIYFQF